MDVGPERLHDRVRDLRFLALALDQYRCWRAVHADVAWPEADVHAAVTPTGPELDREARARKVLAGESLELPPVDLVDLTRSWQRES